MRKACLLVVMAIGLVACAGAEPIEVGSQPMPGVHAALSPADPDGISSLHLKLITLPSKPMNVQVLAGSVIVARVTLSAEVSEQVVHLAVEGGAAISVAWDPEGGSFGSPTPVPVPTPIGPAAH
jgi:hypothetical protein